MGTHSEHTHIAMDKTTKRKLQNIRQQQKVVRNFRNENEVNRLGLDICELELKHVVVDTEFGSYNVYVQGNLERRPSSCVLVTIHDIGCNHKPLLRFCSLPCMSP